MRWAILDTEIYIGHWERGLYEEMLFHISRAFVVGHSAVVLSELRRGARTWAAQRLVESLWKKAGTLWEPSAKDWWEAGKLIRVIGDRNDWEIHKRREFQNDALIALTARRHGATVVTNNQDDFDLLGRELEIQVLFA